MDITRETLEAIQPGDSVQHWGVRRRVINIGEMRFQVVSQRPWRMVELDSPQGVIKLPLEVGDNGMDCEEVTHNEP